MPDSCLVLPSPAARRRPPTRRRSRSWCPLFLTLVCALTGCDRAGTTSSTNTGVPPDKGRVASSDSSPSSSSPAPVPDEPPWFEDITEASGLRFHHVAGTNYFMPDQVGSGIVIFDYDRDGRMDVYGVRNGGPDPPRPNQLFHQEEDGTFRNVSAGSGTDITGRGMGAIAGDLNNDGLPELLVTEYGAVRLLRNVGGGRFEEIEASVSGVDNPRWAMAASFLDYDRDGWLDIVVGNYLDYDPTQVCEDVQGNRDFCAPKAFGDTVTRLWRNRTEEAGAAPRFEDRTEPSGLTRAPGAAMGLVCLDFDGDGWADIFCSDDGRPNRLFVNRRDGTFVEEAALRGLAFNAMGATAANMGTAVADVDGDGWWELFITHLAEEFHGFWKQGPRGLFMDRVATSGLQRQAWRGTGFGAVFADFDRDGHADLALANGLVRRAVPGQKPVPPDVSPWWGRYAQRAQLFAGDANGTFRDLSPANPDLCGSALVGRSLALGDLNRDGAPDLILGSIGADWRVYRNVAPLRGHWIGLRLLDPARGDRDAIGAEFIVQGRDRRWWGMIQPATSYLVSHDPMAHVGLGSENTIEHLDVLWPEGTRERFTGLTADRSWVLRRGQGTALDLEEGP